MSRRKRAEPVRTSVQETPEEATSEDPEVDPAEQARIDAEDAQFAAEVEGTEPPETLPNGRPADAEEIAAADPRDLNFPNELPPPAPVAPESTEGDLREVDEDFFMEQAPDFDPEIFERGPLAAGIRMLNALLVEAEAGYINAQVDELARVLDEQLSDDERRFLGRVASELRTASDLPDVASAYKHLVRARVQAGA